MRQRWPGWTVGPLHPVLQICRFTFPSEAHLLWKLKITAIG
jgi:hypothetical protein